jgi:hypothetical protein
MSNTDARESVIFRWFWGLFLVGLRYLQNKMASSVYQSHVDYEALSSNPSQEYTYLINCINSALSNLMRSEILLTSETYFPW